MNRFRTLVAGTAAALAMTLLIAAPAAAHDQLVSSDPADGATLDTAPTQLTLTYSADIMEIGAFAELSRDGVAVEIGEPEVLADTVTIPLTDELQAGSYSLLWRVVSSDSHGIDGTVTFTVAGAATEPSASADAEPAPSTTASAVVEAPVTTDAPEASGVAAVADEESPGVPTTALIFGGVAIALAGAAVVIALARRGKSGAVR